MQDPRERMILMDILSGRTPATGLGGAPGPGFGPTPGAERGGLGAGISALIQMLLSRMGQGGQNVSRAITAVPPTPARAPSGGPPTSPLLPIGVGTGLPGNILTSALGSLRALTGSAGGGQPSGGGGGGGVTLIEDLQKELEALDAAIAQGGPQYSVENFRRMRERQGELMELLGGLGYTPAAGGDDEKGGLVEVTPTLSIQDPTLRSLYDEARAAGQYSEALRILQEDRKIAAGGAGGMDPLGLATLRSGEQAQEAGLRQQGAELMAALLPYLMDPGQQYFPGFAGGGAVPQVAVQHQQVDPFQAVRQLQTARGR